MRRLFDAFRVEARAGRKIGVTTPLTCRPSDAATRIAAIDDINRDPIVHAWTYRLKEAA